MRAFCTGDVLMTDREILIELLPQERDALLKCILTPDVRDQLEPLAGSKEMEAIRLDRVLVRWVAGDLTHAIVKGGRDDDDIIDLSERFDYIEQTGDGRLDSWW